MGILTLCLVYLPTQLSSLSCLSRSLATLKEHQQPRGPAMPSFPSFSFTPLSLKPNLSLTKQLPSSISFRRNPLSQRQDLFWPDYLYFTYSISGPCSAGVSFSLNNTTSSSSSLLLDLISLIRLYPFSSLFTFFATRFIDSLTYSPFLSSHVFCLPSRPPSSQHHL